MVTYAIAARSGRDGFDIEIVGRDGAHQTMRGFKTQEDAEAWVVEDVKQAGISSAGGFRMLWKSS